MSARWLDQCPCGSGDMGEPVSDARGIFVAYVCDRCRAEKLRGYRPEIFTNPSYDTFDDQVDPID